MKSSGNLSILRFTAWLRTRVSTPYNRAKSLSSITCWPRMTWIRLSIGSNGELLLPFTDSSLFSFSSIEVALQLQKYQKYSINQLFNDQFAIRLLSTGEFSICVKMLLQAHQSSLSALQSFPGMRLCADFRCLLPPCILSYMPYNSVRGAGRWSSAS